MQLLFHHMVVTAMTALKLEQVFATKSSDDDIAKRMVPALRKCNRELDGWTTVAERHIARRLEESRHIADLLVGKPPNPMLADPKQLAANKDTIVAAMDSNLYAFCVLTDVALEQRTKFHASDFKRIADSHGSAADDEARELNQKENAQYVATMAKGRQKLDTVVSSGQASDDGDEFIAGINVDESHLDTLTEAQASMIETEVGIPAPADVPVNSAAAATVLKTVESRKTPERKDSKSNVHWPDPDPSNIPPHFVARAQHTKVYRATMLGVTKCLGKPYKGRNRYPKVMFAFSQDTLRKAWGYQNGNDRPAVLTQTEVEEAKQFLNCAIGSAMFVKQVQDYSLNKMLKHRFVENLYNLSTATYDLEGKPSEGRHPTKYPWALELKGGKKLNSGDAAFQGVLRLMAFIDVHIAGMKN